jgi:hypothetical protein
MSFKDPLFSVKGASMAKPLPTWDSRGTLVGVALGVVDDAVDVFDASKASVSS